MLQRFLTTEWIYYVLALYAGSWSPVRCIRAPPNNPSTVEAQAKFFQYRHLPTSEDFDQGHRLGSDRHFTERHERSRPGEGLFSAKVRWGDKKGGYGEHYWDLNHAGHNNDHGDNGYNNDDRSYEEANDPYDEPSDNIPTYGNEEYDPAKAYEESNRNKRAYPKVKAERKTVESEEVTAQPKQREQPPAVTHNTETHDERASVAVQKPKRHQNRPLETLPKEKKKVVIVVNHKDADNQASQYVQRQPEPTNFVPYEGGAGVRQHQAEEATVASVPRLFLEPSTGHVVDRATGQAYVLQPIKYN